MATSGILNGTSLVLYYGNGASPEVFTAIAYATSGSLSLNMDTRETTNKESGGWRDILESTKSWTMEAEGFYAFDSSNFDFQDLFLQFEARTSFKLRFAYGSHTPTESGDTYYEGDVYITSLSLDSPLEDSATFSASFEGTGVLTDTTP